MNEIQLKIEELKKKIVPEYSKSIDVDEGWYQLVIDCDRELTGVDPNYEIYQVKEKFGTLRFYYIGGDNRITPIVDFYESYTQYICENCGSTVDVGSTSGWIRNVCQKHAKGSKRNIHNKEATSLFNKIVHKK